MFIYPISGPSRRSVSTRPNALGKGDSLLKTAQFAQDFTSLWTKYCFRQMRSPSLMLRLRTGQVLTQSLSGTKRRDRSFRSGIDVLV